MDLEEQQDLDAELVLKCQQGQGHFFGELYSRYSDRIYKFIYYRTRHKQTAEDLTSRVFFKALDNITQFNPNKGKFSTWIFQISRNSLIDFYRTNKNTEDIENVWDLAARDNLEHNADATLAMEKVGKYLHGLSKQQREIVLMRVWDGLSHKEIAEILGLTPENTKTIFSRTLAKLQKDLPSALMLLLIIKSL